MLKKYSIIFLVLCGIVSLPLRAHATGDLVFSVDTPVTVNSVDYTIASGSEATSISVDTTTLTVIVPSGSSFTLVSADRYLLNNSSNLTQACTTSTNSVTISTPITVIFTPVLSTCVPVSGGGGHPVPPPVVSGGNSNSGNTTSNTNNSTTEPSTTNTTVATGNARFYNLGKVTLKNGSTGAAVKELQRFLNDKLNLGLVIDGKFGPKTTLIIKKWQKENGLKVDGLVGAKTKAIINGLTL